MALKPKMILITLVTVPFYMGLAVAGYGGIGAFFAEPAFIALTIATFALTLAAFGTNASLSPGEREDRSNRWVIAAFGLLGLALGYVPAYTDRIGLWTLDGTAMRWFGVLLYSLGGVLRLYPVFVLGRRFSGLVAIQPGHTLVTTGIYKFIRHPSYLGLILNALGWALTFRSGPGVLVTALLLVPLIARIRAEEALLCAQFGAAYDAYKKRSWRLLPGLY
jgi:protein-S-isoprenylcysteine O-methyltransferase Ste14